MFINQSFRFEKSAV